ncbi:MAG: hypothetical protein WCS52_01915 [bacterium]
MPCDLITKIEALYAAYNGLTERCCTSISPLEPDQCAVSSISKAYYAVKQLMAGGSCKSMTESTGAQDPGEIGQCMTGDWLERCEAWINGITCNDEPDLPSVCDIALDSAGGIEGYDQTFSAQEGTIHIEFEAYGIPDQLIISTNIATLLDTGMMSNHLSQDIIIPRGASYLRVQVAGSSSGTAWTLSVRCLEGL